MFSLPFDVILANVIPFLKMKDLVNLDCAIRTSICLQQFRQHLWSSYRYNSTSQIISYDDLVWMQRHDIVVVAAKVSLEHQSADHEIATLSESSLVRMENLCICHFDDSSSVTEQVVLQLIKACYWVKTFSCIGCELREESMLVIASKWRCLRSISFCGCFIKDEAITILCQKCPDISSIALEVCPHLTDRSLVAIADAYRNNLWVIILEKCDFSDDGILALAKNCHQLKVCCVIDCAISAAGLAAMWLELLDLEVLQLRSEDISNELIFVISLHCTKLKHVHITNFNNCSDDTITALVHHCPDLHKLCISHGGEEALTFLIDHVANWHICDVMLCFLFCKHVTNISIGAFATAHPDVQSLHLHCCKFTDEAMMRLTDHCHSLTEVYLSDCGITRIGVMHLCSVNTSIVKIHLAHNDIADEDLRVIIKQLQLLKVLHLDNLHCLTDEATNILLNECTHLNILDIRECINITELSLTMLQKSSNQQEPNLNARGSLILKTGCTLDWCLHGFNGCCSSCEGYDDVDSDA